MDREEIKTIFNEHLQSLELTGSDVEKAMYIRLLDATERIVENLLL